MLNMSQKKIAAMAGLAQIQKGEDHHRTMSRYPLNNSEWQQNFGFDAVSINPSLPVGDICHR